MSSGDLNRFTLRNAVLDDAPEILKIYAPFVTDTVTSLEYEVPSEFTMRSRITSVQTQYPWLICESPDNQLAGFAYACSHREREGYQWITEVGIYLSPSFRGQRIGTLLYDKLFEILERQGYVHVLAGISGVNEPSYRFHMKYGFELVSCWKNCGNKFGKWLDVSWYSKTLKPGFQENPEKPLPYSQIKHSISLN